MVGLALHNIPSPGIEEQSFMTACPSWHEPHAFRVMYFEKCVYAHSRSIF